MREATMDFRYRYVNFGTVFSRSTANRTEITGKDDNVLFDNELALDVGGICWGFRDEALSVIDHHFQREGQFPSACVSVLHKAKLVRKKFAESSNFDVIWLVTHRQPDFDAFCSIYLA